LYYYMSGELRAYRNGKWKLKLPYQGQVGGLAWLHKGFVRNHDMLLFNLADDIGEQHNLIDSEPQRVIAMLNDITQFQLSLGDLPVAKKTGKNMDYAPYISLLSTIVGKLLLCIVVVLLSLYIIIRGVKKRLIKAKL
ncbi:MAG: hypothetical protein QMC38_13565, partial [Sinobacterium sp.]